MNTKGHELFVSRLYDALEKEEAMTSFLSPAQQQLAGRLLQNRTSLFFWGGYPEAERKQLCLSRTGRQATDVVCLHGAVCTAHSKVLGRILHAGIDRCCIGDILCTDTDLYLFCRSHMADSVMKALPFHLEEYEGPVAAVQTESPVQVQAASLRLDVLVSALAGCSRSQAARLLQMGHVKVDDVVQSDVCLVRPGQFLSIRHAGRFRFDKEAGTTRKGKKILVFQKRL